MCGRHKNQTKKKTHVCKQQGCTRQAEYNLLFCEEHDGKTTCEYKTRTGKLCGQPCTGGRKHPWCKRHSPKAPLDQPEAIPVYQPIGNSLCGYPNCGLEVMSGARYCSGHINFGMSEMGYTMSLCLCPGCNAKPMFNDVYCVTHAAGRCQARFKNYMKSTANSRKEMAAKKLAKGKKGVLKNLKANCEECGTLIVV